MLIKDDIQDIQPYLIDEANYRGNCEKVYIVENKQEVATVLKAANTANTPITICGNHTSLTGSSVPLSGWVLSTERLNKIIEINVEGQYAIVEPAVTLGELQNALKSYGLFFPPDPTETSCFIGGMVGTNASGARSFKYGSTRDFIQEIEIVLADGSIININRESRIKDSLFELKVPQKRTIAFNIPSAYKLPQVKNTVSYYIKDNMSVIDLFIGAEGTLGVITLLKVKVLPVPYNVISLVVFFEDVSESFLFLDKIRKQSKESFTQKKENDVEARLIEFFDQKSLKLLSSKIPDIPSSSKAAFWIEQECENESNYTALISKWEEFLHICSIPLESIWFGADERDRAKIVDMRHLLPMLVNDQVRNNGMKKMGTDIAVPNSEFEAYYNWAVGLVEEKGINYVAFGHFGNSHLHLNMLPYNSEQMVICQNIYASLCAEAVKLGGTFSAEHGVGKVKRDYLKLLLGDDNYKFIEKVKLQFDPQAVLGRETLFY
jgi:D-lactate dehydrogenase (cytochrome)